MKKTLLNKAEDIDWHNSDSRSSNEYNDKTRRPAIESKIDLLNTIQ